MADAPLTAGIDLVVNDKGLPEAIRKLGIDAEATRRRIEALALANERALTVPSSRAGRVDLFGDFAKGAANVAPALDRANDSSLRLSQGLRLLAWQLDLPGARFIFLSGVVRDLGKTIADVGVSGGLKLLTANMAAMGSTAAAAGKALLAFAVTPVGAAITLIAGSFVYLKKVTDDASQAFDESQKRAQAWIKTAAELRAGDLGAAGSSEAIKAAQAQAEAFEKRAKMLRDEEAAARGQSKWWAPDAGGAGGDSADALRQQAAAMDALAKAKRESAEAEIQGRLAAKAAGEEYSTDFANRLEEAQKSADLAGLEGAELEKAKLGYENLSAAQRKLIADEIDLRHAREESTKAAKDEAEAAKRAADEQIKAAQRLAEERQRAREQETQRQKQEDEQLSKSLRSPLQVATDRMDELRRSASRPGGISLAEETRGLGLLALSLLGQQKDAAIADQGRGPGIESVESAYRRIEQAAATEKRDAPVVNKLEETRKDIVEAIRIGDVKSIMESIRDSLKNIDELGTLQ